MSKNTTTAKGDIMRTKFYAISNNYSCICDECLFGGSYYEPAFKTEVTRGRCECCGKPAEPAALAVWEWVEDNYPYHACEYFDLEFDMLTDMETWQDWWLEFSSTEYAVKA